MASASARATSRVEWVIQPATVGGLTLTVPRLKVRLYLATASTGRRGVLRSAWLDTGAPLSIIPFHIHRKGLRWQSIPGIQVTWFGQRCELGRIDCWFPTDQPPYRRGPLPLLAKFPQSNPPGDEIPVILGLEFFLAHQAEFQLLLPPRDGRILLP